MFKKYVIYAAWFPLELQKEKLRMLGKLVRTKIKYAFWNFFYFLELKKLVAQCCKGTTSFLLFSFYTNYLYSFVLPKVFCILNLIYK